MNNEVLFPQRNVRNKNIKIAGLHLARLRRAKRGKGERKLGASAKRAEAILTINLTTFPPTPSLNITRQERFPIPSYNNGRTRPRPLPIHPVVRNSNLHSRLHHNTHFLASAQTINRRLPHRRNPLLPHNNIPLSLSLPHPSFLPFPLL